MERIINNELINYLLLNKLITKEQHGLFVSVVGLLVLTFLKVYMSGVLIYNATFLLMLCILTSRRLLTLFRIPSYHNETTCLWQKWQSSDLAG